MKSDIWVKESDPTESSNLTFTHTLPHSLPYPAPVKNKAKGFKKISWVWEKPETQQQTFGSWKTDE